MNFSLPNSPVKVLVADNSTMVRTALRRMIESDAGLRVVGTAQTGNETLEKIAELQPDVVTLDVEMPGLNGIDTLKRIMRDSPRPVIMVSSLTQEGAETTLEALSFGAFDCLPKPLSYPSFDIFKVKEDLIEKIKAACRLGGRRCRAQATGSAPQILASITREPVPRVVALGTSTGGPKALQEILPMLPRDLPVALLVVQHMPAGFTGPFARRLNHLCQLTVQEAEDGMAITPGDVYIAPAGKQMMALRRGAEVVLQVSTDPSDMPHVPSVDVMMRSVAQTFRSAAMGVIMTGMGADGALGMQAIFRQGGITVGQDEATCAVYGMPRSCAEMGILKRVVPLQEIPAQILAALAYKTGITKAATVHA